MAERTKTRQEHAYAKLRADILAGRVQPGQKLPFAELCSTYGVSVGVIREALSRLVEQGLVEASPQQGFSVTRISRADLINLTQARREIESLTLRLAIQEGNLEWESDVVAAEHQLAATPIVAADDPARLSEDWAIRHSRFHEALLFGCSNTRLTGIATQLRASADLYRRWSIPLGHGEPRDIVGEHKAIKDAVVARDADTAAQLLTAHIALTTNLLLEAGVAEDDR
ncbi:MAG: GntR family transcriptional regulator [Microbacteriaceae bacterium]|jgi:DNA-binding GntR family transcriptional regulator|nr:GntR family transcriptional regulator [Microbacteriaceae bacterium]